MKILTAILTCSATQKRADACLDTWIQDIKTPHDYFFYGDKSQAHTMTKAWDCTPDAGEHRARLPEKTYKMLVKSLDYEWDFLFKCDDDTYVSFGKLAKKLETFNPDEALYVGTVLWNPIGYAQGGAGYALTRKAVVKCLNSFKNFYKDGSKTRDAEDYCVGLSLLKEGVELTHDEDFHTYHPSHAAAYQSACIQEIVNAGKITTHYIQPSTMREIYKQQNKI